ncbi:MAG: N-acetylmuramoyl-L-alanine amidase, partial [Arcobacteraceae bacterium]|nr:N-acetylmuramoyl-L-alanine amidase [Arcobacteraceae bacterium]
GGVREGPFWVLVGAQMPSILIEVGYISHPTESKRIYTKNYQKKIADGIANGVVSYFEKN